MHAQTVLTAVFPETVQRVTESQVTRLKLPGLIVELIPRSIVSPQQAIVTRHREGERDARITPRPRRQSRQQAQPAAQQSLFVHKSIQTIDFHQEGPPPRSARGLGHTP